MDPRWATEFEPKFFGQVGRKGCKQDQQGMQSFSGNPIPRGCKVLGHGVAEFHQL